MERAFYFATTAVFTLFLAGCQTGLEKSVNGVQLLPSPTTPYQAVVLTNGQTFFGKLEQGGSSYPVLMDVYYIQNQVNPETKQVTNTLVKRGREAHEPDRMILNAAHVLVVEPVKPDSHIGKLIEELHKR
jgi:hypothetical protein